MLKPFFYLLTTLLWVSYAQLQSCSQDIEVFCQNSEDVFGCLKEHGGDISQECQDQLSNMNENREPIPQSMLQVISFTIKPSYFMVRLVQRS